MVVGSKVRVEVPLAAIPVADLFVLVLPDFPLLFPEVAGALKYKALLSLLLSLACL